MRSNRSPVACAVLAATALGVGAGAGTASLTTVAVAADRSDEVVRRAFQRELTRDPTPRELRRYRLLMEEYGWTEADVRRDVRDRGDYRRYTGRGTAGVDAVIRRAYEDVLGRAPDAEGLRHYRGRMLSEGWTEYQVREALRESEEYRSPARRATSADAIVARAYRDVLRREPDPEGLANYRRMVIEEGWDEHDVRQALRRSTERRQLRRGVSEADATEIVRRAYLSVLGREPDPDGLASYRARVLGEGWTEQRVIDALRDSPEYRNRNR